MTVVIELERQRKQSIQPDDAAFSRGEEKTLGGFSAET
jgi:hypothetical protein